MTTETEDAAPAKEITLGMFATILFGPIVVLAIGAIAFSLIWGDGDGGEVLAGVNVLAMVVTFGVALYYLLSGLLAIARSMGPKLTGSQRGERFLRGVIRIGIAVTLVILLYFWFLWSLFRF